MQIDGQRLGHTTATVINCLADNRQLLQFLGRKRQPALQLIIQRLFGLQVNRHVQQRTAGGQPQTIAQLVGHGLQPVENTIEIGFPDIAATDNPQRQHFMNRQPVKNLRQLLLIGRYIHVQPGDWQIAG